MSLVDQQSPQPDQQSALAKTPDNIQPARSDRAAAWIYKGIWKV